MKNVYKRREVIGDCELYLGDCLDILPTLGKADAVVTDPPYGIGEGNKKNMKRRNLAKPIDYGSDDWDQKTEPERLYFSITKAKYAVVFGGNFYDLPPSSCWLVWDKQNSGDFADCELAWTNLPGAARLVKWRWNGFIRRGDDVRYHPTQKPVGVMAWAIDRIPLPCDSIIDPFMGSGTTGLAAVKLGRRFVGIEISEKYFEIACWRIEEAQRQPDFFVDRAAAPARGQARIEGL